MSALTDFRAQLDRIEAKLDRLLAATGDDPDASGGAMHASTRRTHETEEERAERAAAAEAIADLPPVPEVAGRSARERCNAARTAAGPPTFGTMCSGSGGESA